MTAGLPVLSVSPPLGSPHRPTDAIASFLCPPLDLVLAPGDETGWRLRLERLIDDAEFRRGAAAAHREWAERFESRQVTAAFFADLRAAAGWRGPQ